MSQPLKCGALETVLKHADLLTHLSFKPRPSLCASSQNSVFNWAILARTRLMCKVLGMQTQGSYGPSTLFRVYLFRGGALACCGGEQ